MSREPRHTVLGRISRTDAFLNLVWIANPETLTPRRCTRKTSSHCKALLIENGKKDTDLRVKREEENKATKFASLDELPRLRCQMLVRFCNRTWAWRFKINTTKTDGGETRAGTAGCAIQCSYASI